jgi:hypothetical protein
LDLRLDGLLRLIRTFVFFIIILHITVLEHGVLLLFLFFALRYLLNTGIDFIFSKLGDFGQGLGCLSKAIL